MKRGGGQGQQGGDFAVFVSHTVSIATVAIYDNPVPGVAQRAGVVSRRRVTTAANFSMA
jgi:hypothetical protein